MSRILVVEDNSSLRKLFVITLTSAGYTVWEAADGRAARDQVLRNGLPDFVLLDLILPDEEGHALLGYLRQRPGGDSLPVIAVSGALSQLADARASAVGFNDYLTKPVDMSTLLEVVRRHLGDVALPDEPMAAGQWVLVVDDNPVQAKLLKIRLLELGYQVRLARDGVDALEEMEQFEPDLVISDVLMPRMDGFQLCRAVRATKSIPILLVSSSYAEEQDRQLARSLGACDYVFRTPDLKGVLGAVKAALANGVPEDPRLKELPPDYLARLSLQLERQVEMNEGLTVRCGHLSTALALIATLSGVLLKNRDFQRGLQEVLERLVGEAPFVSAAIYLLEGNEIELTAAHPLPAPRVSRSALHNCLTSRGAICLGEPPDRLVLATLLSDNQAIGLLCLQERNWDSETDSLSFARALGGQLGQGIALARTLFELSEVRERFAQLAENVDRVFWLATSDQEGVLYVSPAYESLYGRTCDSLYQNPTSFMDAVHPEDLPRFRQEMEVLNGGSAIDHSFRVVRPDGSTSWVWQRAFPIRDGTGHVYRVCGVDSDITERRKLEQQLRHATKMEAVGRLAGGVAHDFNNLLTVIAGFTELARMQLRDDDPVARNLEEVRKASERAAGLTRQLLTFSRRHVHRLAVVDLNQTLSDMDRMLQRIIGEDVRIELASSDRPLRTEIDPAQLEQIIVNLVVNARDAMPAGGRLTLSTDIVELDSTYTRNHYGTRPGRYVLLAVSDSGCGMDEETRQRIFEPFFTTKGSQGSGLGLATVFGIVDGVGGHLSVYSEVGLGTTFKVYLPAVDKEVAGPAPSLALPMRGTETILLVEDDDGVRAVARLSLRQFGYQLLEVSNGLEAIALCETHTGPIDLVVSDVVMPGMSGPSAIARVREMRPNVKVLLMSGYPDEALQHHGLRVSEVDYLEKPFTPDRLARKVREVLDA